MPHKIAKWPEAILGTLKKIAHETSILSDGIIQMGDELPDIGLPPHRSAVLPANALTERLAGILYRKFYMNMQPAVEYASTDDDLLMGLQQANASCGEIDKEWIVEKIDGPNVLVKRDNLYKNININALKVDDMQSLQTGSVVSLQRKREDYTSQPGFYFSFGDKLDDDRNSIHTTRMYLCISPDNATKWFHYLTTQLNRYQIPYEAKILRYRSAYRRTDRCIVYFGRRYSQIVCSITVQIAQIYGGLDNAHPFMTRPIFPGIAIADNPYGGESFGLHRMRLIAEGIVRNRQDRKHSADDIVHSITDNFCYHGLNPRKPWLNPAMSDFDIDLPHSGDSIFSPNKLHQSTWLSAADRIGTTLLRQAIWSNDNCSWMSPDMIDDKGHISGRKMMGGDLYNGTSGLGLIFSHLYLETGDSAYRASAIGALRHALQHGLTQPVTLGGYTGLPSVLYAACRVQKLLEIQTFSEDITKAFKRLKEHSPNQYEVDIISGRAGAIVRLLDIADMIPSLYKEIEALCIDYGDQLLAMARSDGDVIAWETLPTATEIPLLGFSHGGAGVSYALYRLGTTTKLERFHEAAHKGFQRELLLFNRNHNNWPDFREKTTHENSGFMCAWCHGAPGNILALSHYYGASGKNEDTLKIIECALNTLLQDLGQINGKNYCLCHGIAGNADILQEIAARLKRTNLIGATHDVAQKGVDLYNARCSWPCMTADGSGQMLGLMTGLAGIAYFYLRLHNPAIKSILY